MPPRGKVYRVCGGRSREHLYHAHTYEECWVSRKFRASRAYQYANRAVLGHGASTPRDCSTAVAANASQPQTCMAQRHGNPRSRNLNEQQPRVMQTCEQNETNTPTPLHPFPPLEAGKAVKVRENARAASCPTTCLRY